MLGCLPTGFWPCRFEPQTSPGDAARPGTGLTHSAGTLNLDIQAAGTLQQPRLNGSLVLNNGALQLAATGERYRDIQMRIVMTGDRIDIQQLRVGRKAVYWR